MDHQLGSSVSSCCFFVGAIPPHDCTGAAVTTGGLGWVNYVVFLLTIFISVAIGIYYGFFGSGQLTSTECISGKLDMHYIPMSLSHTSGFLSAITMLSNPSEMYNYGSQYWLTSICFFLVAPATSYLFLPVLSRLRIKCAYEYFTLRFNRTVGYLMSFFFIIQMLWYSSCIVYAPALALRLVSGITVYTTIVMVYVVCIFYSSVGGIKAAMWSDTVQTILVLISTMVIIVRGSLLADDVWGPNLDTGRLEIFNFDPDVTTRHTFWSVTIGGTIFWIGWYSTNQTSVQRLLMVPSLTYARRGLWLTAIVLAVTYTMLFVLGMLIYAKYRHCDPITSKAIEAIDEILPLYVMDIMGDYPGVPGLFAAGIFSASLSSLAAALNSMTAVAVKDLAVGWTGKRLSDWHEAVASKAFCVLIAVLSIGIVFFLEKLGGILQATISFNSMISGVLLGAFFLGMYIPWTNAKGALCGAIAGLFFTFWMSTGAQVAIAAGEIAFPRKPVSIKGCTCNISLDHWQPTAMTFPLYRVSYLWYSPLGAVVTVVAGILISQATGTQDPRVLDPALVADFPKWITNHLPKNWRKKLMLPTYDVFGNKIEENATPASQPVETIATVTDPIETLPVR